MATPELVIIVSDGMTLLDVRLLIGPPNSLILFGNRAKLALNGEVIPYRPDLALAEGDELAFLPPVSGG